eukprot:11219758-Lingulodinium_polyedra.AAC.1
MRATRHGQANGLRRPRLQRHVWGRLPLFVPWAMAPCAVARPSSRAYVCLAVASPFVLSGRLAAHVVAKHSG